MEKLIIENLLYNDDFLRRTSHHFKPEYFKDRLERFFVVVIKNFFDTRNQLPTKEVLELSLDRCDKFNDEQYQEGIEYLNSLEQKPQNLDWLVDESERFCKERAMLNALEKALEIQSNCELPEESRNKKLPDLAAIPSIMEEALAVGFDDTVGMHWEKDLEARFEMYQERVEKVPFLMNTLNYITRGGAERKTLNLILSGVNCGKSLGMCSLAGDYMKSGLNVLYISLEMSEMKIGQRIDSNVLDINMNMFDKIQQSLFVGKYQKLKKKHTLGQLIFKELPASKTTTNDISRVINDIKRKLGIKIDVLMVDYLQILMSCRTKSENTNTLYKAVAEELRAIAMENNLVCWSAVQPNRSGYSKTAESMDNDDIGDAFAISNTCDFLIALSESEEDAIEGIQQAKQIKSRYGDKRKNQNFAIKVDKDYQRWVDIEGMFPDWEDVKPIEDKRKNMIPVKRDKRKTFDASKLEI